MIEINDDLKKNFDFSMLRFWLWNLIYVLGVFLDSV